MLRSIDIESLPGTEILITFDDEEEMAKATNHQYGVTLPKRSFFGLGNDDLEEVASGFNVTDSSNAGDLLEALSLARNLADAFRTEQDV